MTEENQAPYVPVGDDTEGHVVRGTDDDDGDDTEGHQRRGTDDDDGDDTEGHQRRGTDDKTAMTPKATSGGGPTTTTAMTPKATLGRPDAIAAEEDRQASRSPLGAASIFRLSRLKIGFGW